MFTGNTTANAALPKAGGAMTGMITGFTSTGIDDNATSAKLTVADTGINVGGTVTADGLAVDSSTSLFPTFTTTSATSDVAINLVANSNNYTLGYDYSSNALKVVRGTMSSTTGLIIDSTGAVTMPNQPCF